MHVQLTALLQKQNAGSGKLLTERSDSELRIQTVRCAPFFVAHPVCLLENNSSADSYQNVSTKEVVGSFGADVRILLLRELASVRLAEGACGNDGEDAAQNGRSECDV